MNYSDKVQCYACKGEFLRGQTLIVENPKGRFRVCMNCFDVYSKRKLNEDYKVAQKNVLDLGITNTDAYELMKKKEKFLKELKETNYGRT